MKVKIKKLRVDAVTPKYATDGSGCFDLFVPLGELPNSLDDVDEVLRIPTGLAFEIPEGHVMLVFSRSGHGFKNHVRLSNCVGVIDADYRGELMVQLRQDLLVNQHALRLPIEPGKAMAQALVIPYPRVEFEEVDELGDTARGVNGFGSTDE